MLLYIFLKQRSAHVLVQTLRGQAIVGTVHCTTADFLLRCLLIIAFRGLLPNSNLSSLLLSVINLHRHNLHYPLQTRHRQHLIVVRVDCHLFLAVCIIFSQKQIEICNKKIFGNKEE